jgi:hypothetical protein
MSIVEAQAFGEGDDVQVLIERTRSSLIANYQQSNHDESAFASAVDDAEEFV